MFAEAPLSVSQFLLGVMGTQLSVYHENRIPQAQAVVVVSNHRSFMDVLILIKALERPIRVACHHYMGETPILREIVHLLGCFPLEEPNRRQQFFFQQATELLQAGQWVGIFPEGASPMVKLTQPDQINRFHRGFAHLALRATVPNLAVLPVAIASVEERINSTFPLRLLSLFDPSEPLFQQAGLHPMAIYQRANVLIGRPYWINNQQRQQYQGKQIKQVLIELTEYCRTEIADLLRVGCR